MQGLRDGEDLLYWDELEADELAREMAGDLSWDRLMYLGVKKMLQDPRIAPTIISEHTKDTPARFVKALGELLAGVQFLPSTTLQPGFPSEGYDEMIIERDIDVVSLCSHHLLPFVGKAHFGYIPDKMIVGLSKVPRMIEICARRPQVQEKLSQEIVDTFMKVVAPKGCGLVIEASHMCMQIRGVKSINAVTVTTVVRGAFKDNLTTRQEFLSQIRRP